MFKFCSNRGLSRHRDYLSTWWRKVLKNRQWCLYRVSHCQLRATTTGLRASRTRICCWQRNKLFAIPWYRSKRKLLIEFNRNALNHKWIKNFARITQSLLKRIKKNNHIRWIYILKPSKMSIATSLTANFILRILFEAPRATKVPKTKASLYLSYRPDRRLLYSSALNLWHVIKRQLGVEYLNSLDLLCV
jgi:hypothetical protein